MKDRILSAAVGGLLAVLATGPAMAQYSPLGERQADISAIQQDEAQLGHDQQDGGAAAADRQRLDQDVEKFQYDTGQLDRESGGDHHE